MTFRGPVFIVGLPRSGTKLLRDLLNRNPQIGIPEAETHFMPYFVRKYGLPPRFDRADVFQSFCRELGGSMFFRHLEEQGCTFTAEELRRGADLHEWDSIFEYILRSFRPPEKAKAVIFGDKTPGYLNAMGTLKGIFPSARFLHIIRDPRDCCLSASRAWGLHPYEVAQRWQDSLQRRRKVGVRLGDYMEVRYEELITSTEQTLRKVCAYLDCDFETRMMSLSKSNERTGTARGRTEILSTNMNKFWSGFSRRQIKRIEEIAFDQMHDLGYETYLAKRSRPLSDPMRFILRKRNALAFLRWKVNSRGLRETATFLVTREMRRL